MAPPQDLYNVLGVTRDASADDIKIAFRAKARLLHLDKNHAAGATADFQTLQSAYETLHGPFQRFAYDSPSSAPQTYYPAANSDAQSRYTPEEIWHQKSVNKLRLFIDLVQCKAQAERHIRKSEADDQHLRYEIATLDQLGENAMEEIEKKWLVEIALAGGFWQSQETRG